MVLRRHRRTAEAGAPSAIGADAGASRGRRPNRAGNAQHVRRHERGALVPGAVDRHDPDGVGAGRPAGQVEADRALAVRLRREHRATAQELAAARRAVRQREAPVGLDRQRWRWQPSLRLPSGARRLP